MKTLITIMLAMLSLPAIAQQIKGTVLDDKHKALAGANIIATQNGLVKGRATSNKDGNYAINVLPGTYNMAATAPGYKPCKATNVVVKDKATATQDFPMHLLTTQIREEEKKVRAITGVVAYEQDAVGMAAPAAAARPYQWAEAPPPPAYYNPSTESYKKDPENDFMNVKANPLSTMSVDVDRASYSNVRRFLNRGQMPPADAVRVEELINYFDYDYAQPAGSAPIAIHTELTDCPWQKDHKLLRVGMQARKVKTDNLPASNLVFLVDISGSMNEPDKLPLLVAGMKLLVQNLRAIDKVAIVTYAGAAGLVLPPTHGDNKQAILDALDKLQAGGSTAGGAGIQLAYKVAQENFIKGGNNRVLLATDGDFNVGVSNENDLERLIEQKRGTGIFLTCLGFGTGNYKDSKMELLADKGNGNYSYIDNIQEAQKTLVSEFGGTLFTIAKDVKAQIEFNPGKVQAYRLVGYENRLLNEEDFKDDKKDAGDMGSGHTVTIIYEIIPVGVRSAYVRETNDLKYQHTGNESYSEDLATIKFRYKQPDGDKSKEIVHTIADRTTRLANASENTRFAASVAMMGMLLKESKYKGTSRYDDVIAMAEAARSFDKEGYRAEFVRLARAAKANASATSAK